MAACSLPEADLIAAGLKAGAIARFREFNNLIMPLAGKASTTEAYTLAAEISQKSGMMAYLQMQQGKEEKDRIENVQELFNGIKQFCEDEAQMRKYYDTDTGEDMASADDIITLSDYIENFTLLSASEKSEDEGDDDNKISLMTVHSSKGLEYPYVYVAGLEENLFPSGSDITPTDIEEERRLFYVAITRAQREVTLSFASIRHRYGKEEFNQVSRFVKEIDRQYLDGDVPSSSAFDDFGFGSKPSQGVGWGAVNNFGRSRHADTAPTGKWAPNYGRPQQQPQQTKPSIVSRPIPRTPMVNRTPSPDFKPDRPEDIRVGMKVEHNIFGTGVIKSIEGFGGDAKAIFVTDSGETKKLILKYAKLRICK